MKLVPAILLAFMAVSIACSSSPSSTPTPTPGISATPTPTATATQPIVQVEFPTWVEGSPEMAQFIATSDVIAKAKFVSLDSTTKKHDHWGYDQSGA